VGGFGCGCAAVVFGPSKMVSLNPGQGDFLDLNGALACGGRFERGDQNENYA
jgi:hypothetical protein